MGSGMIVKEVDSPEELRSVLMIREEVFVGEQHVPYGEEMDGREEESIHFIAVREGRPVGCARIRFPSDKAKIERLAVLGSDRGRGVGTALMRYMLEFIKKTGIKKVFLNSQTRTVDFYASFGFLPHGDTFMDAGIEHVRMYLFEEEN